MQSASDFRAVRNDRSGLVARRWSRGHLNAPSRRDPSGLVALAIVVSFALGLATLASVVVLGATPWGVP